MTGAPNVSLNARMTCAGSDAEEERMKRSLVAAITSRFRSARARIAWCIVGTAVYQVGRTSFIQPKKRSASKPGAQEIEAPAPSEAETAVTFRQRSAGRSSSVRRMFSAEAARFDWSSGTIFGRDVVPEVCRISATSPAPGSPARAGAALPSAWRVKAPAGPLPPLRRRILSPNFAAAARAGPW